MQKKLFILAILVLLTLALGGVLWYSASKKAGTNTNSQQPGTNTTVNTPTVTRTPPPPPPEAAADVDRDGLTDEEEATAGTQANLADTDEDGLSDRAEVKVYKSNPLVADSDSDGKRDGEEVKSGSDPNGPGDLLDVSKAIDALNRETQ